MKRWMALLSAGIFLTAALHMGVSAAEAGSEDGMWEPWEETDAAAAPADRCGDDLTWTLSQGSLTIEGQGAMYDFPEGAPWEPYKDEIRSVTLSGVTYVGANAFKDYDALTSVNLGGSLKEAGTFSFSSCDGLTALELPAGFRIFGEESFSHCRNLKEFRFAGGMPSFKQNCLWDTEAKLIYPAANPWPQQHIEQLEGAFQGRIEFLASDGTDPFTPAQPEPETAPPTTEATVPPTTEPVTEPVTEPATQPTMAVTEAPTEATLPRETRPMVPELPENEEFVDLDQPEEKSSGSFGLVLMILLMVLSGGGIIAAVVVMVRKQHRLEEDLEQPQQLPRPVPKAPARKPAAEEKTQAPRQPAKPGRPAEKPASSKPTQAEKEAARRSAHKGGKFSR